jgi:hypothetical protein
MARRPFSFSLSFASLATVLDSRTSRDLHGKLLLLLGRTRVLARTPDRFARHHPALVLRLDPELVQQLPDALVLPALAR